jgi:hypothetical protein
MRRALLFLNSIKGAAPLAMILGSVKVSLRLENEMNFRSTGSDLRPTIHITCLTGGILEDLELQYAMT